MTDKELETAWTKAAKEFEAAKDKCREFSQEHQRRNDLERARQAFETMSDSQRAALVQLAETEGIESQEGTSEL
jgi:hypothetical protein